MYKIIDSLWDIRNRKIKRDRNFLITIFSVCLVIFTVILLFTYVFFNVLVVGASMENTLFNGDVIIANYVKEPTYSSIVVICDEYEGGQIIKRVIAKEGDTLKFIGGNVYISHDGINFTLIEEPYAKGVTTYVQPTEQQKMEYDFGDSIYGEDFVTVAKGEYYYLGDNRTNSSDSRRYGTCKREQILGVVENASLATKNLRAFFFRLFDFI